MLNTNGKNKKSILAATFLRLAIVPSRRITDQGAKAQVICHETSDSCFAWGERELLIAKKLQNHSVFCFWNELIAETEQIRKTEGASLQRSLPHDGDAKCDVAAFV